MKQKWLETEHLIYNPQKSLNLPKKEWSKIHRKKWTDEAWKKGAKQWFFLLKKRKFKARCIGYLCIIVTVQGTGVKEVGWLYK